MPVNEIDKPKRNRLHRQLAPAGVAMQHRAERSLGHFVFEDAAAILVGVAGMDHQRQAGRARGGDMGAKAALLRFARAVLVEIIQPRLAQRHDLRMPGQLDQFVGGNAVFLVGVMRMGADRAIDVRKSLGDGEQPAEPLHPGRDGDDAADAGRSRRARRWRRDRRRNPESRDGSGCRRAWLANRSIRLWFDIARKHADRRRQASCRP